MILPIYIYGHPILRKVTTDIDAATYPNLKELIDNMYETMYNAEGIGIAAPQVGLSDRIFVVDLSPLADQEHPEFEGMKKAFINAHITDRRGNTFSTEEGCLSVPGIHESVARKDEIDIEYLDENLTPHKETYSGFLARVIQHEYDHLDGIMFVDHISPIRKRLIKSKLNNMVKGKISCNYKIRTA